MGSFAPYIVGGICLAFTGMGAWTLILQNENRALQAELKASDARYMTCSARMLNIQEDKQSDATVTDPRDFDLPDEWLFDPATTAR